MIRGELPALKSFEQFLHVVIVLLLRLTGQQSDYPRNNGYRQLLFCNEVVHHSLEANTSIRHPQRYSLEL